ncbi:hypothetical protein Q0F98_35910 [Paenibacillus amylolyticus]|nr:hypothetical protein Q0F98_35910 [Paenibacillus amylolyticus]
MTEVERFIGLIVDTFAHLYEEQGSGMRLGLELRSRQFCPGTVLCRFLPGTGGMDGTVLRYAAIPRSKKQGDPV